MKLLTAIALVPLAGCFYVEAINQRPSVQIVNDNGEVQRGDRISLRATVYDPDNHGVDYMWRIYLCDDGNDFATCDRDPAFDSIDPQVDLQVPNQRANATPLQSLLAVLEIEDDLGATAKPEARLTIAVGDAAPTVELREASSYRFVVNTPLDLYAAYADVDDAVEDVTLAWEVIPPAVVDHELVDLGPDVPDPDRPTYLLDSRRLVPAVAGQWVIRVTATDPGGKLHMEDLEINVVPDHVPCLDQWAPIAPVTATLPVSAPTLFHVPLVSDDLDRYPTIPDDPIYRATTFSWSLKIGSGPRQDLGVTGNSVPFDPAGYDPGTVVELRVEIADRNAVPISCSDADRTCSVISDPTCIQRQTWHVEVR